MKKVFLSLLVLALLTSCEDMEESETQNLDKSGSIEIVVSTKHVGAKDVATMKRNYIETVEV